MRVLVLNPASRFVKNVVRDVLYGCWCGGKRIGGATVLPFEQLLVATVLKEAGHQVRFLDAAAERVGLGGLKQLAAEAQAVVISTSTMTVNEDAETLAELKAANPRLLTVAYGSHPTFMPAATLSRPGVDVIVRREPTIILRELLGRLEAGGDWRGCQGIGFREGGRVVLTPEAEHLADLDELPHLDAGLLPRGVDYFNPIVRRLPYIATSTSAGCPGRCTYCTAPFFHGRRLRLKSARRMLEEVAHYAAQGFREIYFRDETFTASRQRVEEFCRGLLGSGLEVSWLCNARVGTADEPLMRLMRRAGCHLIKVGVESGDQAILDRVKKGIKVEATRELFAAARRVGMDTHAHMMLGMPGETEETVERSIRFALEIEPTTVTFGICTPYPGTPLFEEVARQHPEIRDGAGSDLSRLHVEGTYNACFTALGPGYLRSAVQRAYRSFYLRPGYVLRSLGRLRSANDLKRYLLAGTRVFDFSVRGG